MPCLLDEGSPLLSSRAQRVLLVSLRSLSQELLSLRISSNGSSLLLLPPPHLFLRAVDNDMETLRDTKMHEYC